MLRDYEKEKTERVDFIRRVLRSAGAGGIVYGNSGGKDSALVGILCKLACDNTVGIIMPCASARNYGIDREDAVTIAERYGIELRYADLAAAREGMMNAIQTGTKLTAAAADNIAPRLRMTVLYAIAASEGRLVAGTGNRSEGYMGYYTKWGDGACDFNPIADLTVTEIYEFLRYLEAPDFLFAKAPSAGLFDGQTDEIEMGISYQSIDRFLLTGAANQRDSDIMEARHRASAHKRGSPITFTA